MKHVDPETLAAWSDGGLPSGERLAVESHLADCADCRAMAAAFGQTLNEDGAAPHMSPAARGAVAVPSHSREGHVGRGAARVKFILPFAATIVIASGVAWKLWPRADRPDEPTQTVAMSAPIQPQAPVAPPIPNAEAATSPARRPVSSVDAVARKTQKAKPVEPKGVTGGMPAAPSPAPMMPPPPAAQLPPPPQMTGAAVTQEMRVVAAGAQAPPIRFESVTMPPSQWRIVEFSSRPAAPVADFMAAGAGAGNGRAAGRGGSAARSVASTSASPVRWRLTGPSSVERSTDDGASWTPILIEGPAVLLTAGASPSANVCWLVGKSGAILIWKNNGAFRRVIFPEVFDLLGITAVDELRATVVTADGRSFVTEDGGLTWRARF